MILVILIGLLLPLFCLGILDKENYHRKHFFMDAGLAIVLFIGVLIGVNWLGFSTFDEDSLSSLGILASLMMSLIRKADMYKVIPYNAIILIVIKAANVGFLLLLTYTGVSELVNMLSFVGLIIADAIKGVVVIVASYGVRLTLERYHVLSKLHYRENMPLYLTSISLLVYIGLFVFQYLLFFIKRSSVENDIIPLSSFAVMVVCLLTLLVYTRNRRNVDLLHEKELYQAQLVDYMAMLERNQQEMRKFKHDYKNMLLGLRGYLDEENLTGAKAYFTQHVLPASEQVQSNNRMADLSRLFILELKGLLMTKLSMAEAANLSVSLEISEPVTDFQMDIVDACRCLGILLDNAIEASQSSVAKQIQVAFIHYPNALEIVIQNSAMADLPPVYRFFEEGFSTKGQQRGLGLTNVQTIVDSYEHVHLETAVVAGNVRQTLRIEKER